LCDNNTTVVVNPGTVTNRSHQAFVVGSNSIYVVNRLEFTKRDGHLRHLRHRARPEQSGLVTCTADVGGGFTLIARGFFTPAA
jgi:hypothetical protein